MNLGNDLGQWLPITSIEVIDHWHYMSYKYIYIHTHTYL